MSTQTMEQRLDALAKGYAEISDTLEQLAKDLELASVNITRAIKGAPAKQDRLATPENTFTTLKWTKAVSSQMGEFEVASKADNSANFAEAWQGAYNFLNSQQATIKTRYHAAGYGFSYWLFGEKIYRQKLKEKPQ